jgi:hypothetical protein
MSALILPSRFRQQPQGAFSIDWNHPLFKNGGKIIFGNLGYAIDRYKGVYSHVATAGAIRKSYRTYGQVTGTNASTDNITLSPAYTSLNSVLLVGTSIKTNTLGDNNNYGLANLTRSALSFGDGTVTGPDSRRTYVWSDLGGAIFVRPDTSILTAPILYSGGVKATVTYSSGNATAYSWAGTHYNIGLAGTSSFTADDLALAIIVPGQVDEAIQRDVSRNPWQIFKAPPRFYFAPDVGAGSQTLTPGLFTNGNTFYSPTVTPGQVTLTPALFTASQTFYSPTVTPGPVTLTATRLDNTQAFYAHVVSQAGGTQTLLPDLLINAQSFYAPTVSGGSALFTPEQLAYILAYVEANMAVPTVEEIAAAVIAALNATTIPVNIKQFNSNPISGTGRPGDPVTAT